MKLLFVSPYVPLETKPRPYRFIEHLARRHDVHLVAFDVASDPEYTRRPDYQHLCGLCASMTLLPLPRYRRFAHVAGSVFSARPARVAYYGIRQVTSHIRRMADRLHVDAVHVDRLRLAELCASLSLPKVVDATDCISDYLRQCIRYAPPHMKPAYAYEAAKTVRFERRAALEYSRCLVTTERERLLYAGASYFDRLRTVPNIMDSSLFERESAQDATTASAPMVLFVGNLGYFPNVDAAHFLLATIWPRIRRQMPEARLVLAGASPQRSIRRAAAGAEADLTGFVPDLAQLMLSASVIVAPLRIAVGFPNKIAESLALGKPVVSTRAGARGLDDCSSALVSADGPDTFAHEVVRLLRDADARAELGAAARAYAWQHFHPTVVKARFDAVYEEISGNRQGTPLESEGAESTVLGSRDA
jgi:polysaccharide biosynthesis protein PslH